MKNTFYKVFRVLNSNLSSYKKNKEMTELLGQKRKEMKSYGVEGLEWILGYPALSMDQRTDILRLFYDHPPSSAIAISFQPFYDKDGLYHERTVAKLKAVSSKHKLSTGYEIKAEESQEGKKEDGPEFHWGNPRGILKHKDSKNLIFYMQPRDRTFFFACTYDNIDIRIPGGFFSMDKKDEVPKRITSLDSVFNDLYSNTKVKSSTDMTFSKLKGMMRKRSLGRAISGKSLLINRN